MISIRNNNTYIMHIGDIDYVPGPYNVTFLAGMTRVPFDVVLLNNNTITIKEFNVSILTPGELSLRNNSTALVTITGANGKWYVLNHVISLCHTVL